jgi:DNA repair exonuclease SbcCD nuclease subunit
MPRKRLRLIHTADIHVGDDYNAARRLAGLAAVADATLAKAVDALLIAGDLFDNARVAPEEVGRALEQLARLTVPVFVTPGNHDCLGPPSIYSRVRLSEVGLHVHFLGDPVGSRVSVNELGLDVWARGLVEHDAGYNPLLGHKASGEDTWQIVMAHGHFVPEGGPVNRSSPILAGDVGALACDYLALGHWHGWQNVSTNGVPAYYPGSPSDAVEGEPTVNLVTLDPMEGVRVQRLVLPAYRSQPLA